MPRGSASQGATVALVIGAVLLLVFALSSNTISGVTQSIINALNFSFSAVGCAARWAAGVRC